MTPEQLKQIKERLLIWKEEHQDEYNRFAQHMDNCESDALLQFYRSIASQSPDFIEKWEQCYNDDTKESFEDIKVLFQQEALPKQIIQLYQEHSLCTLEHKKEVSFWWKLAQLWRGRKQKPIEISAPMIYAWLFFGKSFESMVKLVNKQLKKAGADNADKWNVSYAVESIITASIQGGFRTREQWDKFFAMEKAIEEGSVTGWAMSSVSSAIDAERQERQKADELDEARRRLADLQQELSETKERLSAREKDEAWKAGGRRKAEQQPLSRYLDSSDNDAVLEIIRRFIAKNNTGYGLAMPYFALANLGLLRRITADKEYSTALNIQFEATVPGLIGESSCRQALGKLKKPQRVIKNGKKSEAQLIEDDRYRIPMEILMDEIRTALHLTQ